MFLYTLFLLIVFWNCLKKIFGKTKLFAKSGKKKVKGTVTMVEIMNSCILITHHINVVCICVHLTLNPKILLLFQFFSWISFRCTKRRETWSYEASGPIPYTIHLETSGTNGNQKFFPFHILQIRCQESNQLKDQYSNSFLYMMMINVFIFLKKLN